MVETSKADKYDAIVKLAPDLISWLEMGRDFILSEGAESLPHEDTYPEKNKAARLIREATDVIKRFTEILGIKWVDPESSDEIEERA